MKQFSILSAVSAGLVAGSLVMAGPAAAHRGDAGDASRTPAGQSSTSTSAHSATEGQIGVGIFTEPAPAAGTQKPGGTVGAAPAYAPAPVAAPATAVHAQTVGGVTDARVGICNGCELPIAPIGAAPAA